MEHLVSSSDSDSEDYEDEMSSEEEEITQELKEGYKKLHDELYQIRKRQQLFLSDFLQKIDSTNFFKTTIPFFSSLSISRPAVCFREDWSNKQRWFKADSVVMRAQHTSVVRYLLYIFMMLVN